MADKLDGNAIIANTIPANRIQTGSITSTQLQTSLYNTVTSATHPKIRSISYPGNDTAANTGGGDTVTLTGTGFGNTGNVQIYINGNVVSSITVTNANSISFTAPALAAATYPVYLINTSDGSTAILIPGIQYSGTPSWSTSTPLSNQDASSTWSIQLVATSDSAVSYSLQAGSSLPAGITLAANGLISGTMTSPPSDETTYNFTVVANDLENQDASRAFSVTVTVAVLDPYFAYTTLLLHGDGTNNANNHAFVDSSNNAFTITRNGNASQGTFSPFGDNWSNYFDGTGDYLNFTNQATTGDFTCECWFYRTGNASGTYQIIFGGSGQAGATNTQLNVGDDGSIGAAIGGSVILSRTGTAVVSNQWNHLAWVRSGTTVAAFVNGNRIITGTSSSALNVDRVGGQFAGYEPIGYISNARITTSAVYNVSATSVTVPSTPLTAISNTYVLTCQSNAFIDKGPNRLAITRNGDTRVSKFDPFKPYKAIPASYGVYFDGTGDYLQVAENVAFNVSNQNFTIECWVNFSSVTGEKGIVSYFATDAQSRGWVLRLSNANSPSGLRFVISDNAGGNVILQSAWAPTVGVWYHVAVVRNSTTLTAYINGTSIGSTTINITAAAAVAPLQIGIAQTVASSDMNGHISNLRLVKGTALYTSNFTPSTSTLTAVANTSLLTCQSTTIIDNSTNAFTITTNGDARPTDLNPFTTTFVSEKYNTANGGGAVYVDGNGDFLSLPSNDSNFNCGTGNFTLEFWFYDDGTSTSYPSIFSSTDWTPGVGGVSIRYNNTGAANKFYVAKYAGNSTPNGGSGVNELMLTSSTYASRAWHHVAFVRNGNNFRIYVNGTIGAETTSTVSIDWNLSAAGPKIGGGNWDGANSYIKGYIANLRLLKGTVLYTAPFVPPTAPVTNIANTSLLCNFTNAGILDSVGKNVLETVGDARVNTSVKKYGTGSMYFDGTGDYLKAVATVDNIAYGTGDFTVECWAYFVNAANLQKIFDNYNGNNNPNAALCISNPNANKIQWYSGQTKIVESTSSLSNNTWYHIAVSRTGSTTKLFINGNQEASASDSNSYAIGNGNISIGAEISTGLYSVNGHIDDLRITKGVARYRYNFTPPTKAFNDGDGNLANNTTDVLVGDQVNLPVFPYTTLLLHGDGTNNANNHAFLDSSNNAFAITRNGNATQGTFSPFSPTGWSGYFDGTGDDLATPASANMNIGTGDFTVEAWIYPTSFAATRAIFSFANYNVFYLTTSGIPYYGIRTVSDTAIGSTAVSLNIWSHIAFVRSGTTLTCYLNGTSVGSITTSSSIGTSTDTNSIGSHFSGNYWLGYISNIRVVKGTAVYTSSFTPSTTPLTAIANTQLLTCQSNRFIDNSNNAFTITRNGDTSIQAFSPFAPSVEYAANTHGGSAYFDGTGDYLTWSSSGGISGTGDYTISGWFYMPAWTSGDTNGSDGGFVYVYDQTPSHPSYPIGITISKAGKIIVVDSANFGPTWLSTFDYAASYNTSVDRLFKLNQWNYIHVYRQSGTIYIYCNGLLQYSRAQSSSSPAAGTQRLSPPSAYFNGYSYGFRVLNVAVTDVTVPTSPPTAVANTQLLLNFTNAGILDSTGKNVLETVGDARVNTAIKKYGTGSMYFDGTGDYLVTPSSAVNTLAGDFTVEMWVYRSAGNNFFFTLGDSFGSTGFDFYIGNTGANLRLYSGNSVVIDNALSSVNFPASTWTHLAIVRSSGSVRVYVAGMQAGSAWSSTAVFSGKIYVGAEFYNGSITGTCNGYMDDVRVTNGIARYVTNFTPPTAAFLNK